jgi:hypothetical protein
VGLSAVGSRFLPDPLLVGIRAYRVDRAGAVAMGDHPRIGLVIPASPTAS